MNGDTVVFEQSLSARTHASPGTLVPAGTEMTVIASDAARGELTLQAANANDWSTLEADVTPWRWYLQRDAATLADRFSFVVSVALPRAVLDQAADRTSDVEGTVAWIEQIVREEMPAHILPVLHWLDAQHYADLANTYGQWHNGGQPLGDLSYRLLELLAIGFLRNERPGINARRVASVAQKEYAMGAAGDEWHQERIDENELFYVPQAVAADDSGVSMASTAPTPPKPRKKKARLL